VSWTRPLVDAMKCPICREEVTWEGNPNRPFCSERCRLIDLGNWANGQYSLPAEETNTEETDTEEQNVET
jgi:endogenous inhibitor of DNA gyrase (YacG/DUF329 family)